MAGHSHDDHDHSGHYHPDPSGGPVHFSDPAQESLSQALQSGFNVLRVVMIVLVVAYFASGWFQVKTGEEGLIVRFGQLRVNNDSGSPYAGKPIFGPGFHASLPDPFDQKIRIPGSTATVEIDSFCFPINPGDAGKPLTQQAPQTDKLIPGVHGTMFSGDRFLSFGLWKIEYRIEDGEAFVMNVGENATAANRIVYRLGEAAITRTVAGLRVERITRIGTRQTELDFTLAVRTRLQEELKSLKTGIVIDKVTADTLYPALVHQAFVAAQNAANQGEQMTNDARRERSQLLNKAAGPPEKYEPLIAAIDAYGAAQTTGASDERLESMRVAIDAQLDNADGEVAIRLRQAQANANSIRESLRREYEEFINYLAAYKRYPRLTATRLWVRMREAVLTSPENEMFFVPDSDEIRIQTNRDPQRILEEDERRYRDRYRQPNQ